MRLRAGPNLTGEFGAREGKGTNWWRAELAARTPATSSRRASRWPNSFGSTDRSRLRIGTASCGDWISPVSSLGFRRRRTQGTHDGGAKRVNLRIYPRPCIPSVAAVDLVDRPTNDGKNQYETQLEIYRAGGFDQVRLETGADLLNLGSLDQKLWVALACPTRGIEFDPKTLDLIDIDKDGRIRAPELIAATQWAGQAVKNADDLLKGSSSPLPQFDQ